VIEGAAPSAILGKLFFEVAGSPLAEVMIY